MNFPRQDIIAQLKKYIDKPLIKVLTGLRRSGKSTIMKLLQQHLLACGIPSDQIIYLNFESLSNQALTSYKPLYEYIISKIDCEKRYYIFLDEIQEVAEWERTVNSLLVDANVDVYITGSNSNLLSSELSTYLAGRYIEFHLQTLSFAESIDFYNQVNKDRLSTEQHFDRYLSLGGFPVLHIADYELDTAYKIVYDIYTSTILRDTVQRHKIRDIELLERVIKFTFENMGQTFSANSIAKYFKGQQRSVDVNTIHNYLHALESSFLLSKVERFDLRGKEILKTQEKYFPGDFAFLYALFGYKTSQISGILENMVYAELKRRGYKVFVGKLYEKEIDFVATRKNDTLYIQVAYKLGSEETIEREYKPLLQIKDAYPKYLISMEKNRQDNYSGVKHVHIKDFLLAEWY